MTKLTELIISSINKVPFSIFARFSVLMELIALQRLRNTVEVFHK